MDIDLGASPTLDPLSPMVDLDNAGNGASELSILTTLKNCADLDRGIFTAKSSLEFIKCIWNIQETKSKCLALQILIATDVETLRSLLETRLPDLLMQWLKIALADEASGELYHSMIVYALQLFAILPMDLELLRRTKFGRIVKRLVKHSNTDIQKLSTDLMTRWTMILETSAGDVRETESAPPSPTELDGKKVAGQKRVAPASTSTAVPAPKFAKSVDMSSMFGAPAQPPKAKKKIVMQSIDDIIKTALPPPRSSSSSVSSRSNSIDVLSLTQTLAADSAPKLNSKGLPQKRVSWAPDGMLLKVKTFESDEADREARTSIFSKKSSLKEGEAIKHPHAEEMVTPAVKISIPSEDLPWIEPKLMIIPEDAKVVVNSHEASVQIVREKATLGVFYYDASHIPDSAIEPEVETESQKPNVPRQIQFDHVPIAVPEPVSTTVVSPTLISNLLSSVAANVMMSGNPYMTHAGSMNNLTFPQFPGTVPQQNPFVVPGMPPFYNNHQASGPALNNPRGAGWPKASKSKHRRK